MAKSTANLSESTLCAHTPSVKLSCETGLYRRGRAPAGHTVKRHIHPFWHAEIATAGRFVAEFDGQESAMQPGDLLLIPQGVPHGFRYGRGGSYLSLKFHVRGSEPLDAAPCLASDQLAQLLRSALELLVPGQTEHGDQARAVIEQLLAALVLHHYWPAKPRAEPREQWLVRQIREYVRAQGGRSLSVAQVARHLGYSISHVSGRFRKLTGTPLKRWLDAERGQSIAKLLTYGDVSISEIAAACEFPDLYSFSRFFKRATGSSPRAYRQKMASVGASDKSDWSEA